MHPLVRFRLAAAAALCALLLAPPTEAYYDDAHYHLTYYLARAVGYTPEQAHRIASANLSIDYDPDTEPVQQTAQLDFKIDVPRTMLGGSPLPSVYWRGRETAQVPRIRFHAFMDCLAHRDCLGLGRAQAEEVIPTHRNRLWNLALQSGNPGAFLHFLQDEIPHSGYPSDQGHWTAFDAALLNDLPLGIATDSLAYDGHHGEGWEARGKPTIAATVQRMKEFMEAQMNPALKRTRQDGHTLPRTPDWTDELRPVLSGLRHINPVPPTIDRKVVEQLRDASWNAALAWSKDFLWATNEVWNQLPQKHPLGWTPPPDQAPPAALETMFAWEQEKVFLSYDAIKRKAEPNYQKAAEEINHALRSHLKATDQIPEAFFYSLDAEDGLPAMNDRDRWVLFGDVTVSLILQEHGETVRSTREPIFVKLLGVPTYEDEEEWEMVKDTTNGEPVHFKKLLVGQAILEITYQQRTPLRRTFSISRRVNDVTATVNLDEERATDETEQFSNRLLELERQSNEQALAAEEAVKEFERQTGAALSLLNEQESVLTALEANIARWTGEIAQLSSATPAEHEADIASFKVDARKAEEQAHQDDVTACVDSIEYGDGTPAFRRRMEEQAERAIRSAQQAAADAHIASQEAESVFAELAQWQTSAEQLRAEISAAVTGVDAAAAQAALAAATEQLNALTNHAAALEAIRHEADEIAAATLPKLDAVIKERRRSPRSDPEARTQQLRASAEKLRDVRDAIKRSHAVIIANHEQWQGVRLEHAPALEAATQQAAAIIARHQTAMAALGALVVPLFDAGSASADVDTARASARDASASAEHAETCPKEPRVPANRITSLRVRLEPGPPEEDADGERPTWIVVAVLSTDIDEPCMLSCYTSVNPNESATRLETSMPNYAFPLDRYAFQPGEQVSVTCVLAPDGNTMSSTTSAPEFERSSESLGRVREAIEACEFDTAHQLIEAMPATAERRELVRVWNAALLREQQALGWGNGAMDLWRSGKGRQAIAQLEAAIEHSRCDQFLERARDDLGRMQADADPRRQMAQLDCSSLPGTYAMWNPQSQQAECQCSSGWFWSSGDGRCMSGAEQWQRAQENEMQRQRQAEGMAQGLQGLVDVFHQGTGGGQAGGGGYGGGGWSGGSDGYGAGADTSASSQQNCANDFYFDMRMICNCPGYAWDAGANACVPGAAPSDGGNIPGFQGWGTENQQTGTAGTNTGSGGSGSTGPNDPGGPGECTSLLGAC